MGNLNIVLLSGGSGKRLWPLSNDVRSKQFIKIFKKEDGSYESMLQRVFHQIRRVDPGANVTIATARIDAGHVMMTRTPKCSSRNAPSGRFGLSDASRK